MPCFIEGVNSSTSHHYSSRSVFLELLPSMPESIAVPRFPMGTVCESHQDTLWCRRDARDWNELSAF